ncbi:hypothetical protein [Sphingopyxis kveilinensis]|uniref:hypothetical protein n=1 Tax=Sphingopyxis kveilinensis TaxID=3114367 RepID=UPI0030CADD0A
MDAEIINRMREEEAALMEKLRAVRNVLIAYGERPLDPSAAPKSAPAKAAPAREKVEITGYGAYHRKSVALAMMAMGTSAGPVKSRQLVQFIEAMGHEITGKDKINALGALLSRSVDIQSHGKVGWTLIDREKGIQIAHQYSGLKEKEPTSEAVGSVAGEAGAPPPADPWRNPQSSPTG